MNFEKFTERSRGFVQSAQTRQRMLDDFPSCHFQRLIALEQTQPTLRRERSPAVCQQFGEISVGGCQMVQNDHIE